MSLTKRMLDDELDLSPQELQEQYNEEFYVLLRQAKGEPEKDDDEDLLDNTIVFP